MHTKISIQNKMYLKLSPGYRFYDHVANLAKQHDDPSGVVVERGARPDEADAVHDGLVVGLRLLVFGVHELIKQVLHCLHVHVDVVRFAKTCSKTIDSIRYMYFVGTQSSS